MADGFGPHVSALRLAVAGLCAALLSSEAVRGETLVEKLLASYDGVQSVSCEVRRETNVEGGKTMRMLSRVHWKRGDRLNVQTVTPLPRRIVADGTSLFSYIDGDRMGFSRPVEKLDPDWLLSLRKIPGTPTEHLLRLKGVAEVELPATEEYPVRRGYQADHPFVVVSLDASNRVACITFYKDNTLKEQQAQYRYLEWVRKADADFALRQEADLRMGGVDAREVTQVLRVEVNAPQPAILFEPKRYFKDVTFTDDIKEIYK